MYTTQSESSNPLLGLTRLYAMISAPRIMFLVPGSSTYWQRYSNPYTYRTYATIQSTNMYMKNHTKNVKDQSQVVATVGPSRMTNVIGPYS